MLQLPKKFKKKPNPFCQDGDIFLMATIATEYTQDKINVLKNQIQQAELEMFAHELQILDAEVKTGDTKTDNTFEQQAANSRSTILLWERKMLVRKAELVKLEAIQAELNKAKPQT